MRIWHVSAALGWHRVHGLWCVPHTFTQPIIHHLADPCARVAGAGNYSANTLSCEPCQIGEFCVAGTSVGVRCPLAQSTTNGRGARSEGDCVCQVGYYMDEDGCVPCRAMGTNCTAVGVTVATLPLLEDWWRLPNSTQLERCYAISNCTGGSDALQLCGEGYEVGSPYNLLHPLSMPYISSQALPYIFLTGCLLRCLFGGQQRNELSSLSGPVQAV